MRDGPLMWLASLHMAPPSATHSPFPLLLYIIVAAASPRFSPQRSLSKGRHWSGERACRHWKPLMINSLCTSQPITTAVSQRPASMLRMAAICALRPLMHALLTTTGGLGLPKWWQMMAADVPSRALSVSPLANRCTLPLVVERKKRQRGEPGSIPARAMASLAEAMHRCSKNVCSPSSCRSSSGNSDAVYSEPSGRLYCFKAHWPDITAS